MATLGHKSSGTVDDNEAADAALSASAEARLRALDAMLGGVAHDLNNALSVVLMNLDVMQQDAAVTAKHGRRIDGMLGAMTNASTLVRHLLNFSHSRRPEPQVVSVAEVLESLVELLQVAVGKEIDIAVEADEKIGPCCVMVDPASFEVGVIHAALQLSAMIAQGGVITFRLGKNDVGDDVILSLEAEPRERDWLGVEHAKLDLALIEHFAREAQGRVTKTATDAHSCGLAIHLPACSETVV
jgi:hypothetical protein